MDANFEICEEAGNQFLLLKGDWSEKASLVFATTKIRHLRLSAYAGWWQKSIHFLKDLPMLERLDLWSAGINDISPLYNLSELKALSVNGVTRKIDFARLPKLTQLHLSQWRKGRFESIFSNKRLNAIELCGYSGPDLRQFESLPKLENLAISFSRIESLKGAGNIPALLRLSFGRVNRLVTLYGLDGCRKLALLWIEGAKRLSRIDALSKVRSLRTLNLSGCPVLDSLQPLKGLPEVEAIWLFNTSVVRDGDLSVLLTLPKLKYAKFVDRKHYSHKNADFPKNEQVFM